jgi:hypothetical protein
MKKIVLFSILVMLTAAAIPAADQPDEVHVPALQGWTAVGDEYRYGRDNLWEYINGAAELFLTYGFSELIVADFEQGDAALTVSVYDMGRPLDAFGVFETEKPESAEVVADVGSAAVMQAPYQGLLLKDKFYVKIEVGGGDVKAETLLGVMQDVAVGLPGDDGLPPRLADLPAEDRVPGSVAYAGGNFLGFEGLNGCLHAEYKSEAGEYRLFVMKPGKGFLSNETGKWTKAEQGGKMTFFRKVPYEGVVVLVGDEERMIGVAGFEGVDPATELLMSLMP